MDDTHREINMGSEICGRIKRLRYANTPWGEVYKVIAKEFVTIKEKAKAFYPGEPILKLLANIRTWSDEDITDAMSEG